MKTQADVRNSLGDDISWKARYAEQNKIYETKEEALASAIKWCSGFDVGALIIHLTKG